MIAIVSVPCTLKLLQGNDVHLSACVGCHLVIFIEKNGIDIFVFTDYKIADLIGKVRIDPAVAPSDFGDDNIRQAAEGCIDYKPMALKHNVRVFLDGDCAASFFQR